MGIVMGKVERKWVWGLDMFWPVETEGEEN